MFSKCMSTQLLTLAKYCTDAIGYGVVISYVIMQMRTHRLYYILCFNNFEATRSECYDVDI